MVNDNEQIKGMHLPKTNPNEDLETISELNLLPLFDPSRFEKCKSDKRDKGIDLTFEIKNGGNHTGFRFIIQLKATNSIDPNNDKSLSKSIDTSNINYLLNNHNTAYYILHDQRTGVFYFENILDFIKELQSKNSNWDESKSHVLRFHKILTAAQIDLIYSEVIEMGLRLRELQLSAIYISNSLNSNDRVTIDSGFNVVDDGKIREYITKFGFHLISEGKWKRIIELHNSATGNVGSSPIYNLILGISHYYLGNRWDSLSFLKKSKIDENQLNPEQKNQLLYFDATVRYSCGQMEKQTYQTQIDQLEKSESIGLFIKLHKAKQNYLDSLGEDRIEQFDLFKEQVNEIVKNKNADKSIILTAKCELILYQGYKNNHDYLVGISRLNALEELFGINVEKRVASAKNMMQMNRKWYDSVIELTDDAKKSNNIFAYYTAVINEVMVSYKFLVYTTLFKTLRPIPGVTLDEKHDNTKSIEIKLSNINDAVKYFEHIGHIENLLVSYSAKYELLKFCNRDEEADGLMSKIELIVEQNDLSDYRERIEKLKNNGCTHELFQIFLDDLSNSAEKTKAEYEKIIETLKLIDSSENEQNDSKTEIHFTIELFPIGYFSFPTSKRNKVYQILNISDQDVIENFNRLFEIIIPVANIFYESIDKEGPQNGRLADQGISSWRNILRVRKEFHENGFYRVMY